MHQYFPFSQLNQFQQGKVVWYFSKIKDLARKVALIRDYGKVNLNDKILHKLPAVSNGRLNEFSASIVSTFLENYKRIYLIRKEIASIYDDNIPNKLIYQKIFTDRQKLSYYKYITFVNKNKFSVSKVYDKENQLFSILKDNEIYFKFIGENPLGVNHVCLPIFPNMQKI